MRTTAVVTTVSGRHDHLRRQREGLWSGRARPDLHVVVAMGDDAVREIVSGPVPTLVVDVALNGAAALPLARARNAGVDAATDAGAETIVFLDVDCIPGPRLVQRYAECVESSSDRALYCGPVSYLPPPPRDGYDLSRLPLTATGHPARPTPGEDEVIGNGDHALFWSLSFALDVRTWRDVNGFDERYVGYGGEDTDFGQRARRADVALNWVGGAWAYHQFHPTNEPPTQHLHDILRNARLFRDTWGWWPMSGWLDQFALMGLAQYDRQRDDWTTPIGTTGRPA